jgi:hypothetical protein
MNKSRCNWDFVETRRLKNLSLGEVSVRCLREEIERTKF